MQPEQIEKAIAELWVLTQNPKRPASEIINEYTRARRYIGSKDRKAITQGVWDKWRALPYPKWLADKIPNAPAEINAMKKEALPVLRANGNRDDIIRALMDEGVTATPAKLSPLGIVLNKRYNLNTLSLYKDGKIEVQDEGSQLVALACGVQSGDKVFDMCAGAGGKSLAFAQMMKDKGKIVAHDVSKRSLDELEKRAVRAKISIIRTSLNLPRESFDVVVCDVPCSGTGTGRRAPDAAHKITPEQFEKLLQTQREILDQAAKLVKDGGRLCYITCSLTRDENEGQAEVFLKNHPTFTRQSQKRLTPANDATDGFFLAIFKQSNQS